MKTHPLALLVATFITGCAVPGERAANDGACPKGEVCSDDTPQGLQFWGAGMFDSILDGGPNSMAVGGAQRITVEDAANSDDLAAFDADGTNGFTIGELDPPDVTVVATAEGTGYLRILEPGTDDLYDRLQLVAMEVTSVDMQPAGAWLVDPDQPLEQWSLLAGAEVTVGARIFGGPTRLVDESLTIDVTGGTKVTPETSENPPWDTARVIPDASGEVAVTIQLGSGKSFEWAYPISEKVEKILRITTALSPDEDANVPAGASRYFCFRALDGDLAIAGVPWTFESDAGVELDASFGSCVAVESKIAGPHVLTVKAGDAELALDFEVVASAGQKVMKPGSRPTSARERLLGAAPRSATPGERFLNLDLSASPR